MRRHVALTACVGALALGCVQARDVALPASCDGYRGAIAPLLTTSCGDCHSASHTEAGYRLDSYPEIVRPRPDGTRRVVAGDASSLLLRRAAGESGHPRASDATLSALNRWVTVCGLSYFPSDVGHAQGFVNPDDPSFHGTVLQASGWDFDACARCHGEPTSAHGGPTGRSCTACHAEGVTTCNTCHFDRASPSVGAHRAHVLGGPVLAHPIACESCHVVPADWRDIGHIFLADAGVDADPRAEVVISAGGSYDRITSTCSEVACHGALLVVPAPDPVWTSTNVSQGCATCHAMPPDGGVHDGAMTLTDCATCHGLVVDGAGAVSDPSLHLDGVVSLGDGSETCNACHDVTAMATGEHLAHVQAHVFSGPIACDACHLPPGGASFRAAVISPGHLDTALPAEVFPGGAEFPGLAAAAGFIPTFDAETGACTSYCHSAGSGAVVSWTAGVPVLCGECHARPPSSTIHNGQTYPNDCVTCHAGSVNADGTIKFQPDGTTLHTNGEVNVQL
ncbi:MAG: CxxxxCH/CxxCH domain-containing protein [Myxococcota bacterium]